MKRISIITVAMLFVMFLAGCGTPSRTGGNTGATQEPTSMPSDIPETETMVETMEASQEPVPEPTPEPLPQAQSLAPLYSDDKVKISFKELNSEGVIFEVENLTDVNVTIQADSISINKRSFSNSLVMSSNIAPLSIGDAVVHCEDFDTSANVETIGGRLRILDLDGSFERYSATFVIVPTDGSAEASNEQTPATESNPAAESPTGEGVLVRDETGFTVTSKEFLDIYKASLDVDGSIDVSLKYAGDENLESYDFYVNGTMSNSFISLTKNGEVPKADEKIDQVLISSVLGDEENQLAFTIFCSELINLTNPDIQNRGEALPIFGELLENASDGKAEKTINGVQYKIISLGGVALTFTASMS